MRRARAGHVRAREIPALALALVWALGFEAAPALHALEHAAAPRAAHCHGTTCHDDHDDGATAGIGSTDHGAGSLAHRDVAALAPLPAIVLWPAIVFGEALPPPRSSAPILVLSATAPVARGPPARS